MRRRVMPTIALAVAGRSAALEWPAMRPSEVGPYELLLHQAVAGLVAGVDP